MQLAYLWIKEYKKIKQQGFTFTGRYSFKYENGILDIKQNPYYIPGFFDLQEGSNNITEISALVGENGTGKSSVLEFLKTQVTQDITELQYSTIIVLFDEKEGKFTVYYESKLLVSNDEKDEDEKYTIEWYPYDIRTEDLLIRRGASNKRSNRSPILSDTTWIFYSPIFDARIEPDVPGVIDVSTNHLIDADSFNSGYVGVDKVAIHRSREIERQVDFITARNGVERNLPFNLPNELFVEFLVSELDDMEIDAHEDFIDCVDIIEKRLLDYSEKSFEEFISYVLLNHFFTEVSQRRLFESEIAKSCKEVNWENVELLTEQIRSWLNSLNQLKYPLEKKNALETKKDLQNLIKGILDFHLELLNFKENKDVLFVDNQLQIPLKYSTKIKTMFKKYKSTVRIHEFLAFNWRNMSSGERAWFNLLARFNAITKYQVKPNVIILIDEGEAYLHPQWQVDFLRNIAKNLPYMFGPDVPRQLQIILTSNSPFVVSDLPSSNVNFLKLIDGTSVALDGLDDVQQTFAANIHHLLSHSFFMKGGSTGNFSKLKINEIINILVNEPQSKIIEQKEYIKKLSHLIGEPIIRSKILQMLQDKMVVNFMDVDEKIADLQQQINKLRETR